MKRIVLIDTDIVLFRVTQQNDHQFDWGSEMGITTNSDLEHIKTVFDETIAGIVKKVQAEDYILCISGENNFRKTMVTETYKANRKGVSKPANYYELKEYALKNHPSKMYDMLEADDVMGIMMTMNHPDKEYVIHSDDKDMWTIEGLIWDRKKSAIIENSKIEADRFLYKQILTGDRVDGYQGCPSIGKVKAEKLLKDVQTEEEMKEIVLQSYIKVYKDEGIAKLNMQQQAQLARILRATDFDFKEKVVKLWKPWGDL